MQNQVISYRVNRARWQGAINTRRGARELDQTLNRSERSKPCSFFIKRRVGAGTEKNEPRIIGSPYEREGDSLRSGSRPKRAHRKSEKIGREPILHRERGKDHVTTGGRTSHTDIDLDTGEVGKR